MATENATRLDELENGERFNYNGSTFVRIKKISTHSKYEKDVYLCKGPTGEMLFSADAEVDPHQHRVKL